MLTSAKHFVTYLYSMTTDAIYEERGSDWSHQVSAVGTTRWLQHDQTLPLSAKGVACETTKLPWPGLRGSFRFCFTSCITGSSTIRWDQVAWQQCIQQTLTLGDFNTHNSKELEGPSGPSYQQSQMEKKHKFVMSRVFPFGSLQSKFCTDCAL